MDRIVMLELEVKYAKPQRSWFFITCYGETLSTELCVLEEAFLNWCQTVSI